jgi:undecaprenyl-diphosphatase
LAIRASRIAAQSAHIVLSVHPGARPNAVPPPRDPGSRRALRALLRGGPLGRRIAAADVSVYRAIRSAARPGASDAVRAYSTLGEHAGVWLVGGCTLALLDRRRRAAWLKATASVGAAYTLNTAVKAVFRRRRPTLEDLPALMATPTALSFPSAHASSSFAAARAFSALAPSAAPALYAAAAAMAVSRVYLGVHYPTDVLAGAALGSVVGGLGR